MSEFIDKKESTREIQRQSSLKYLPHWPPVSLSFEDICYSIENGDDTKIPILRSLSGHFSSGQLIAIMGPSGAGKTTLLNVLAGYNGQNITGSVLINNKERDIKMFRKMSRYIMQEDIRQVGLTVRDVMTYAADLKLGFKDLTKQQKKEIIEELIRLIHLEKSIDTECDLLSGGELKRLSICQELVNNPPILFLDEPTTGLDDHTSFQCIKLLKNLAKGGRTVICSIHTPSANVFKTFDHVYLVANGQCAYQGNVKNVVSYMEQVGLSCPKTFNPADFLIEAACGDYGREFVAKMIEKIENGRISKWRPNLMEDGEVTSDDDNENSKLISSDGYRINEENLKFKCSTWEQFTILLSRSSKQIYRNKNFLKLRFFMHIILGCIVGGIYWNIGNDASKSLYNFGFCFTIIIAFLYIPMMPNLIEFPTQVQTLKREHFNRWYRCFPYYFAMIFAKLPIQLLNSFIYLTMVYFLSAQPVEATRILWFYSIAILTSLTSESLGILVASRLSIVNANFVGPALVVPLILFSVYNMGTDNRGDIALIWKICMASDYLRYSLEGIVETIYGFGRPDMECPEDQEFCVFKKPKFLTRVMGFEDNNVYISIAALFFFYILFNSIAIILIKNRLSVNKNNPWLVRKISYYIKKYLN